MSIRDNKPRKNSKNSEKAQDTRKIKGKNANNKNLKNGNVNGIKNPVNKGNTAKIKNKFNNSDKEMVTPDKTVVAKKSRQQPSKIVNITDDMVCPYAKKCGGCDYQGMDYAKQLEKKQKQELQKKLQIVL